MALTVPERIAKLEEYTKHVDERLHAHSEHIGEIYDGLAKQQAANTQTATSVASLARIVEAQHTPETCPQKPKIERMWQVFVVVGGLIVAATVLGWMPAIGQWLISLVRH